jgi:phage-related protein
VITISLSSAFCSRWAEIVFTIARNPVHLPPKSPFTLGRNTHQEIAVTQENTRTCIMAKELVWLGDAKGTVSAFPKPVREDAGHQLWLIQEGDEPADWKPMPIVGAGVAELRIHHENEYRVLYVAKFAEAIYVLHAFEKKTQRPARKELKLAAQRYKDLVGSRKQR